MANAGTDEIAVLAGSSNVYHNTLALFRDFHDICCYSKVQSIVSKSTRTGVEQCGVDFRYICNTTASIVERISSGWIANCIIFFEEPEAITKEDALSISDECAQLTEGFRKIHSYVVGMSERLHDKFEEVKNDNQLCLDEAEKAIEAADLENKLADNARKEAEMEARKAQSSQDGWFIAAWIPVVNIVALPMYLSSCDKTAEAMTAETGATEKSKIAAQIKHEAVKHQESAKVCACVHVRLMSYEHCIIQSYYILSHLYMYTGCCR